jgi:hypothetical protein
MCAQFLSLAEYHAPYRDIASSTATQSFPRPGVPGGVSVRPSLASIDFASTHSPVRGLNHRTYHMRTAPPRR